MEAQVQPGDKWKSIDQVFRVIDVVTIEGNIWIHYMKLKDNTEYSCLQESFLQRFTKVINESY